MYSTIEQIVISALLHDVGKLCSRASGKKVKHSDEGAEYILSKSEKKADWQEIIEGIKYHHQDALIKRDLSKEHIAYIICEADNISAGLDRRESDESNKTMWDKNASLKSVFNILDGKKPPSEKAYDLKVLKQGDNINFPKENKTVNISQQRYQYIINDFEKGLEQFIQESMSVNSLLRLIELSFYSIPSSTDTSQLTDISLYHHSKTTAMVAACLYSYFKENNITDYKKYCLTEKNNTRKEEIYLLAGGDVSGIQSFIYSVSSKGALKSLRGRSFYLEILVEHIIDEILEGLSLSRANLIYSGGGHFYMLLPNTQKAKNLLNQAKKRVNEWLLDTFSTDLYIEMSFTPATANDLSNNLSQKIKTTNSLGELYRKLGYHISKGKLKRYGREILEKIMISDLEKIEDFENRECSVCGKADNTLFEFNEEEICDACYGLYSLGDIIPRIHNKENGIFLSVAKSEQQNKTKEGMLLPSILGEKKYLYIDDLSKAHSRAKEAPETRFYSLNNDSFGYNFANNLWTGSYNYPNKENKNQLIELSSLSKESKGIKRLAMLKADVDNLGNVFKNAFIDKKGKNPYQFVSLSRNTSLSYFLSMFFKHEINKVAEKNLGDDLFQLLPNEDKKESYKIVIVYSGGDDLLAVGAWDEILEFAINLNKAFKKYTLNTMTLSAGIGFFQDKYPINQMAMVTDELEKGSKLAGKNSLSLFGSEISIDMKNKESIMVQNHIYSWENFESKVYQEKFLKLYEWFDISNNEERKIPYSSTGFYKLMTYVSDLINHKGEKVNIARIAYILARMEPDKKRLEKCSQYYNEFKSNFYQWVQKESQLKELLTAMMLIIYLNREE